MLRVIAYSSAFEKIPVQQLPASKQYCPKCVGGTKIIGIAYIYDDGSGTKISLCENHANEAMTAMQNPTQGIPQQQTPNNMQMQEPTQQEQIPQGL